MNYQSRATRRAIRQHKQRRAIMVQQAITGGMALGFIGAIIAIAFMPVALWWLLHIPV